MNHIWSSLNSYVVNHIWSIIYELYIWMFIYGSSCSTIYDQQIDRKLCEIWNHIWTFKCSYMIKKIIICRHIKSLYMIDHIWLSSMIIYLLIYEHIGSYMIAWLMFIYEHLTAYDSHANITVYEFTCEHFYLLRCRYGGDHLTLVKGGRVLCVVVCAALAQRTLGRRSTTATGACRRRDASQQGAAVRWTVLSRCGVPACACVWCGM